MRWEYTIADAQYSEEEKRWVAWHGGRQHAHLELLNQMGNDGWELVGLVINMSYSAGGAIDRWYHPVHSLYFKRPKP